MRLATFDDLDPGRQPELVAGDVRAGDAADDLRLDPEVPERLDQRPRHLLLAGRVGLGRLAGRADEKARARDPPDELRVVGDRRAVAALRGQLRRRLTRPRPRRRRRSASPSSQPPRLVRIAGSLVELGVAELVAGLGRRRLVRRSGAPRRASRGRSARPCRARASVSGLVVVAPRTPRALRRP